jgi:hypothetical protein
VDIAGQRSSSDLLGETAKHLKNEEAPAVLPPVLLSITAVGKCYFSRLRAVVV